MQHAELRSMPIMRAVDKLLRVVATGSQLVYIQ